MQTIVIIGIFQAVVTVLLFVTSKRKKRGELLLVAGLFFCVLHLLSKTLLLYVYDQLNKSIEISTFFQTIYSFLSYLYVLKLSYNKRLPPTDKYLFIIVLSFSLVNYVYVWYRGITAPSLADLYFYNYINYWLFIGINLWFIAQVFRQARQVSSYWREEITIIRQINTVMAIPLLLFIVVLLSNTFPLNTIAIVQTFSRFRWVNYSVLLYVALTLALYKFKMAGNEIKDTGELTDTEIENFVVDTDTHAIKEMTLKAEVKEQPRNTEGLYEIFTQLETLIKDRKLYKDPELTVEKVSNASGIYVHQISASVNQLSGKPFQVFINEFRVKEVVKELARCREKNITPSILELAFEAGFNSKSSFNLNFKKQTGYSPTGYLKNMKYGVENPSLQAAEEGDIARA